MHYLRLNYKNCLEFPFKTCSTQKSGDLIFFLGGGGGGLMGDLKISEIRWGTTKLTLIPLNCPRLTGVTAPDSGRPSQTAVSPHHWTTAGPPL